MNQPLIQWWLTAVQATLNAYQPTKQEDMWALPDFKASMGFNHTLLNFWSPWYTQPPLIQPSYNWQFMEDALSHFQELYLKWIAMTMPVPLERIESRIAQLEEQTTAQAQAVDGLRRQINQGGDKIPESVSALQDLIEKQGREFHRLTDGFKAFAKEHAAPSGSKK